MVKIWDAANHSAFTDLIKFRGSYYCSFREGSGHVPGTDGIIRILKSPDARNWKSITLLSLAGMDLRDPKLSVTPEGRIMVIIGGSVYKEGKLLRKEPQVSFSDRAGRKFSAPEKVKIDSAIISANDWIWRVTWHDGTGYAIDYQIVPGVREERTPLWLLKTMDGKEFEKVSKIDLDGSPNEATIRFDRSGKMYVLIRRETGDQKGVLDISNPPYTEWQQIKLQYRLGGPNFIFTEDEKIIAGTRVYESKPFTGLFYGDNKGDWNLIFKLPSGGDNSYPGLILEKKRLLVSYYSSHEGKTAIYLAEIPRERIEEAVRRIHNSGHSVE